MAEWITSQTFILEVPGLNPIKNIGTSPGCLLANQQLDVHFLVAQVKLPKPTTPVPSICFNISAACFLSGKVK